MTDPNKPKELDAIVQGFESRKAEERKATGRDRSAEPHVGDETRAHLTQVVLPALSGLADQLTSAGQRATVHDNATDQKRYPHPSVMLGFRPVDRGDPRRYDITPESTIEFAAASAGRIVIRTEDKGPRRRDVRQTLIGGAGLVPTEVERQLVTAEWIRRRVFAFVATVLQSY